LIRAIRKFRPEVILGNALSDRHPDHGRAGHLIEDSAFLSGLVKVETFDDNGKPQEKWRPKYILHYIQDWYHEPDLIIDISDSFTLKMKSIQAYTTQFHVKGDSEASKGPQTYISTPDFLDSVIARARMLGKRIGVKYGEGFNSEKKIGLSSLEALLLIET
jgi:N-acetylglucosamine malate deacetylase 1